MVCVVTDNEALLIKFRAKFPEFSTISDAIVESFFDEAKEIFIQSTNGILWLTAHFVQLMQDLGINTTDEGSDDPCTAAINMYKIGDVTFQFKDIVAKVKDNKFISTSYGQRYLIFRDASQGYVAGGFVSC